MLKDFRHLGYIWWPQQYVNIYLNEKYNHTLKASKNNHFSTTCCVVLTKTCGPTAYGFIEADSVQFRRSCEHGKQNKHRKTRLSSSVTHKYTGTVQYRGGQASMPRGIGNKKQKYIKTVKREHESVPGSSDY